MYKESTMEFKISSYKNSDVPNACRTHLKTISDKEWICLTCHRHLKKGAIPPQAQVNNMSLPEETCILDDLTDFESRLLAKRIPFMKITALPRGRQRGILGSVINVPSDVDETCEALPRTPTSAGIIPVKLKRKQEYKSHVFYEHVRPNKVVEAFHWLQVNNIHYQEVTDTTDNWEENSSVQDSELWNHLTQSSDILVDDSMASFQNNVQDSENLDHSDIEILDQHVEQPLDTCIQGSDLALDVSKAINFSPAEGKTPVGFMMDHGCEEMAFPKLFPTGKFGFDA